MTLPGQILPNVWDSFEQGEGIGHRQRLRRRELEYGDAYQEGGLDAVYDRAAGHGDFEQAEGAREMQRRQRTFESQDQERAFRWFEQNAPYARNVLRAARNMPEDRRAAFLNNQRQRFEGMGFPPEQIDSAIAALTNPETAEQAFTEYDAAFSQYENPDWQISPATGDIYAVDPSTGQPMQGGVVPGADLMRRETEAGIALNERNASAPYNSGGGGVQYRPMTPEEAQAYGITNPADFAIGSNGLPRRVGGGGTFPAEQRARVAIMYTPALEAAQQLEAAEAHAVRRQGTHGHATPIGQDWLAAMAEAVPFDGGAIARSVGGEDYTRYRSASSSFEAAMLPILSGAAVTESEARRIVRSVLPQVGDNPQVLADKARRRRQMLNGAALIGGRELPHPDLGLPSWARQGEQAQTPAVPGAVGLESLSDEQLDALEQELLNGGR